MNKKAEERDKKTGEKGFIFEELIVYQKGLEYVDFVYKITKEFPKHETFSLIDQFRRTVSSLCLNIAEGSGGSKAEFKRFLNIARRSVRECVAITEIAFRQKYLTLEKRDIPRRYCSEISKMLNGLIKSIS